MAGTGEGENLKGGGKMKRMIKGQKICQNCQKFLTCEVVKIIRGGRCHPDWIEMGDRIAEICNSFGYCPQRGEEEKCQQF